MRGTVIKRMVRVKRSKAPQDQPDQPRPEVEAEDGSKPEGQAEDSKAKDKRVPVYYVVYDVAPKWDDTKKRWTRNQKWEKAKNYKHAEKLLAERLAQINNDEYIEPSRVTFETFQDTWMTTYAEGQVRPSTLELYRYLFRRHIIPALGKKELAKIGVADIQALKSQKLAEGLSEQSVKHILRLVRQMLDHAVEWNYLRKNPARKVKYPRIPRPEMTPWTPEEARVFLEYVREKRKKWYAFFLTALTTGMRIGELLAMRWTNVDWHNGQYMVKEAWQRPRGGRPGVIDRPKTESSRQAIDLTPSCLDALREHRVWQAREQMKAGKKYQDQDLIFASRTGHPLDDRNLVNRIFNTMREEAGLRPVRFHDLRHTYASILIAQGESVKYVQKQLRHASAQVTLDRYAHLFEDTNREAARRVDETLFGTSSQTEVSNA